jgi:predicted aspartyl protease
MKHRTLFSLLFALLMSGSFANAQLAIAQSTVVYEVIPAKLYHGYLMVVQGTIGDLGKRNFAIDTGAFPSVIDRSLAKKLHLASNREELRVVDRNLNSEAASVPNVAIGSLRASHVHVLVEDLTSISENFRVHLDAIIGLDVLAARNFRIDYSAKKLIFDPADALPMSAPMNRVDAMACIDLQVDERPARLLLDTGGASVLLFANRLPWAATLSGAAHTYTNLGGTFRLREVPLRSLALHQTNLGSTRVYVSDARNLSDFHFDGLLATGALPVSRIDFDFKHQLFGWEPSTSKKDVSRIRESAEERPAFSLTPAAPLSSIGFASGCVTSGFCGTPGPIRIMSNK